MNERASQKGEEFGLIVLIANVLEEGCKGVGEALFAEVELAEILIIDACSHDFDGLAHHREGVVVQLDADHFLEVRKQEIFDEFGKS